MTDQTQTLAELLAPIRERVEAATEGPWDADCCSAANMVYARSDHIGFDGTAADATFIAHARTDVPQLVAALDAVLALKDFWRVSTCGCGHRADLHGVDKGLCTGFPMCGCKATIPAIFEERIRQAVQTALDGGGE